MERIACTPAQNPPRGLQAVRLLGQDKSLELRAQYDVLQEDRTPIVVFTFSEVDLGLDLIPFDDLTAKYRVEAAITADFSGTHRRLKS